MFAFAALNDGRKKLETGAFGIGKKSIDHLLCALRRDLSPARRAVLHARARIEQTQVVMNFRDRAHGRARVAVRRLLVDRHCGRKPLDKLDLRLVHLAKELARVA